MCVVGCIVVVLVVCLCRKIMYRWLEGQGEHYSRDKQGESDGASLSSLPPAVSVVVESILKRCVGGGSKAVSVLVLLLR